MKRPAAGPLPGPSPRRSASSLDVDSLAGAVSASLPMARVSAAKRGENLILYGSLDMKRNVDYEQLRQNAPLLQALLEKEPSGIFLQGDLEAALDSATAEHELSCKMEAEAYRVRVMLAHLRLVQRRGMPNLEGPAAQAVNALVAMLIPAKAGPPKRFLFGSWRLVVVCWRLVVVCCLLLVGCCLLFVV